MKKINKFSVVALALAFLFGLSFPVGTAQAACSDSIGSNFNGTDIPAGRYVWFNSHLKLSSPVTSLTTIHFTGQTITFNANSTPYTLTVPDGDIILDPGATTATTVFDTASNKWKTTVPVDESGNIFLAGLSYPVPASGLPGGINPVTWAGNFSSTVNFSANWQWSAAVYTTFSTNYNNLGVKPIDGNTGSLYQNSDHAGTPENYKAYVTGGARGGGGSNWTGSWSGTGSVDCAGTPPAPTPPPSPTPPPAPATLHIVKTVINNSGGTATASSFTLHVKLSGSEVTGSPASGVSAPGRSYTLSAGTYVVSEDANSSYAQIFSGDCDLDGSVMLTAGSDKTCTVTNDDIPPTAVPPPLIDITKVPTPLSLPNGPGSVRYDYAVSNPGTVAMNNITVTDNKCSIVAFISGDTNSNGWLDVNETWNYRCTMTVSQTTTNTVTATGQANGLTAIDTAEATVVVGTPAVPPLIDVVKVPSPLSLPNGPGQVTYTYTLRNIGTVPVTSITMIDDTCSPLTRISGDTDGDNQLDVNEVWTYRCSMTISQTKTNTVVTTGWANGLSAVDITTATVVVGASTVPPLIHVTTVPNPNTFGPGGGMVTYTETVTNPGTVSLSNVTLVDNTCSPMTYVSGDTDNDSMLDVNETWTYTCQKNTTQTTTNTATATGQANGMTATDVASATVVVGTPGFPNTGALVPPLIHVTTVPNPNTFGAGGGMVTYTYVVTNPGTVAVRNVGLTDNTCSAINYISGDTNGDGTLNVTESWNFNCRVYVGRNTTNTATATGKANGFSVRDFALSPVIVSASSVIPGLPNTGYTPEENSTPWYMVMFSLVLILTSTSLAVALKKHN